jgi:hypothetical protein
MKKPTSTWIFWVQNDTADQENLKKMIQNMIPSTQKATNTLPLPPQI